MRLRTYCRFGVGMAALALASATAQGQALPAEPGAEATDQAAAPEDDSTLIIVSGSRIVRDGYDAPTPVSVITEVEIKAAAPVTIADYVNQLPALAGSTTPRSHGNTTSGGLAGANLLNLRGLGPNRTLTLLNGRRVTPSTLTGAVDVNTLPTGLVERVDVVTGGASAAWGSDAVSGVVNFVLDTDYEGVKGNIQAGTSQLGDAQNFGGDLSMGTSFAGGRGHVLFSGNYSKTKNAFVGERDWYKGYKIFANPAFAPGNGQPARLILPGSSLIIGDYGLIASGPLRGTAFDVTGQVATTAYPFGPIVSGLFQSGGPANGDFFQSMGIISPVEQGALFGRASFDISDAITVFGEAAYGDSRTDVVCCTLRRQAPDTVRVDNFFLPASVRDRMIAAGVPAIASYSNRGHLGIISGINERSVFRTTVGADGKLGQWRWNASYQYGRTEIQNSAVNNFITARYLLVIDAVADPLTGNPICRSTLTDPGNGCVPLNPFGGQSLTTEQRDYFIGRSEQNLVIRQDVAEVGIQGPLFATGAGDVVLATGLEYRKERARADADPISRAAGWFVSNYAPFNGEYDIKEGFLEVLVPVFKDSSLGRSLDLSGAVRHADYNVSGGVTTWKIGGTYQPVDDVQLRVTRSRDIRAPNLNDLFVTAFTNTVGGVIDPVRNNTSSLITQTTSGNLNLKPEKADSFTAGIVYQPSWAPGVSFSADYYNIKINDAIATASSQQIVNQCFAGGTAFCDLITRNPDGSLAGIRVLPFNALEETARGIDLELGYRTAFAGGNLNLRTFLSYVDKLEIAAPAGVTTRAGELGNNLGAAQGVPHFTGLATAMYTEESLSLQLKARLIGGGKMERDYGPLNVNRNDVPPIVYVDAFVGFNVGPERKHQVYFAVDNALDKDPPVVVSQDNTNAQNSGTNLAVYDAIGRTFRAGFRFAF